MKPKSIISTLAFCALASGLQAATLYWDGGGPDITPGQSDNATTTGLTWLGTAPAAGNWDNGATSATVGVGLWNPGDSAVFGGTAATQTVTAGTLTIGNLTFGQGGDASGTAGTAYTISGGTITLSASSVITANTDTLITSALAGTGNALVKEGAAKLTLTGTKTYTGGTTVNAGTLSLGTGASIGVLRGALAIGSGAQVNADTNWSFGYGNGTCVSTIAINGGTLNFTGTNENGGTSASGIALTGGTISGSRFDWFNGITNTPTLTTVASATTTTVSSGFRMRYATTSQLTLNVAQGTTSNGIDLLISGNITTGATNGIIKSGTGTAVMSGANTYGGATTVNAGVLVVDGSLANSAVTANASGTLAGTGTVKSATVSGTVSPGGSAIGTLTVTNALTLNSGSTTVCQINRTATQTADQLYVTSVSYGGTLSVENTGDTLEVGDKFYLFDAVPGSYAGSFSNFNLPTLSEGLNWDMSGLTVDGSITVVNYAPTPVFSPAAGGYIGAQNITMNSGAGTTIHYTYTTDGTEPANPTTASTSGTPDSGTAAFSMPTDSALWIKAIATKAGSSDSPVASATYGTVTTPTWTEPLGGTWSEPANWNKFVVASGANVTADFSTLPLTENIAVAIDGARTIGSLAFGDPGSAFDWTLSGSALLTLEGADPAVTVVNRTATVATPVGGTDGLTKAGAGTLALTGVCSYTGPTTITNGVLSFLVSNHDRFSNSAGNITINSGATFELRSTADARFCRANNEILGAGTFRKTGPTPTYLAYGASLHQRFNLSSGGLIHVAEGVLSDFQTAPTNAADLMIDAGATARQITADSYFDELTGGGTLANGNGRILTFGVDNGSGTFTGTITGALGSNPAGAIIKTGSGNQTLAGANTYTGTTTVNGGTLTLTGSLLLKPTTNGVVNTIGGTASLVLDGSLALDLSTTVTTNGNQWLLVDVTNLDESFTGNFGLTAGVDAFAETSTGSGVWTLTQGGNKWTFTKSTGVLGVAPAGGFQSWIDGFTTLTNAADKLPGADPDHDGLSNIIEFILNGDPTSGAVTNRPTVSSLGADLVFTFTRRDDAESLNPFVEFSTNLQGAWTKAVDLTNCTIEVQPNGTDPDTITVTIPKGANTRLFARLAVTQ